MGGYFINRGRFEQMWKRALFIIASLGVVLGA